MFSVIIPTVKNIGIFRKNVSCMGIYWYIYCTDSKVSDRQIANDLLHCYRNKQKPMGITQINITLNITDIVHIQSSKKLYCDIYLFIYFKLKHVVR